jgi:hypothetical protein
MASVIINGDTSGAVTLSAPAVAGTVTVTLPAASGTMLTTASTFGGTGPAFSAYASATFTVATSTYTKIPFNTELFDTNSNFDSTTNYRFTPTVAGYYQVQGACFISPPNQTSGFILSLYKNGSEFQQLHRNQFGTSFNQMAQGSLLLYLNGTSDYIELYMWQNGGGTQTFGQGTQQTTWFNGCLVRSA